MTNGTREPSRASPSPHARLATRRRLSGREPHGSHQPRAPPRAPLAAIPFMFLSYPCCNRLQVNPRPPLVAAAGTAVAAAAAAPATAGAAIATIIADTIAAAAAVSAAIAAATAITAAIAAASAVSASVAHTAIANARLRYHHLRYHVPPLPCSPLDSCCCCCCYCHSYHHRSRHRHR